MKAAIDIGTNTVLLLVAEVDGGTLQVIHEEQRMPRLGRGVDSDGVINDASRDRVAGALNDYKQILMEQFPEVRDVVVTATSAVRDAANRDEFIGFIKKQTGYSIRLLSGMQEAQYTYEGALAVFSHEFRSDVFVLDIGGGSTELALGREGRLVSSFSFDMGCVRFSERYLRTNPPLKEEIGRCREEIRALLAEHVFSLKHHAQAVGVAGTLTSLAAIDLQLEQYDPLQLNAHTIARDKLRKQIKRFSDCTHEQLLRVSPNVLKGREDLFVAGLLILEEFMAFYKLEQILVSTGGIRHGVLLNSENL